MQYPRWMYRVLRRCGPPLPPQAHSGMRIVCARSACCMGIYMCVSVCLLIAHKAVDSLHAHTHTSNHFLSFHLLRSAKLRALPSLSLLTEHMRKQGFHVVFASAPTMNDLEIGICNIRSRPNDKWFLTRFVASPSDFSAVMKSEDSENAAKFVKQFSLAKVLKIDTTRTQVSNTTGTAGAAGGGSSPQR